MTVNRSNPKISVIMPVHNRQEVVAYSIESVLSQSYDDFELIIIDDASTDSTSAIIGVYANKDPRISIVKSDVNSRTAPIQWEPRNDGLRYARGEYIAYLDSDNLWHRDFLKSLSRILDTQKDIQLVHCDSQNHYTDKKQYDLVISQDLRTLVTKNDHNLTAIFSYKNRDAGIPGVDWYIDTNEIMHRRSVFEGLGSLWSIKHPNHKQINQSQIIQCPYRRHNDQDLVDRIIQHYGSSSVSHITEALTYFYYPGASRKNLVLKHEGAVRNILKDCAEPLGLSIAKRKTEINLAHFFSDYLSAGLKVVEKEIYDFGVGEIVGDFTDIIKRKYEEYSASQEAKSRLIQYGGTASQGVVYQSLAGKYNEVLGLKSISEYSIIPCDGGHNALFHSISVFLDKDSQFYQGKNKVSFMVPAYPYWTMCAAANARANPIEAYSFEEFISSLEKTANQSTAAIIINSPHNPLGISISEEEVERVNSIARANNAGIIVDIPYHSFIGLKRESYALGKFAAERTIYCDSASKAYAVPGLRLGFAISGNPELAALLRAHKSASSLLPSSSKVGFLHFLDQVDIASQIKNTLDDRKARASAYLTQHRLPAGVTAGAANNSSMYNVLFISRESPLFSVDILQVKEYLQQKYNVIVMPEVNLFPPMFDKGGEHKIIRLSYGKVHNVEQGLQALINGLQALTNANTRMESANYGQML